MTVIQAIKKTPVIYKLTIIEQLETLNFRLKTARETLADQKMDTEDFREIKLDCTEKISALEAKLTSTRQSSGVTLPLIKKALSTMLVSMLCLKTARLNRRERLLVRYPEKMSFDGNTFRTTRLNSAVDLFKLDKDFSKIKNRTNEKKVTCPVGRSQRIRTIIKQVPFETNEGLYNVSTYSSYSRIAFKLSIK